MSSNPADSPQAHAPPPKAHIRRRREDKGGAPEHPQPRPPRAAPANHLAALHHLLTPSRAPPTQHGVFRALAPPLLGAIVLCCVYLTLRTHLVPAPAVPPALARMGVTGARVAARSRSPILHAAGRAEEAWRRWTGARGWRGAAGATAGICTAAVAVLRALIWVVATVLSEDGSREVVVRGGEGGEDQVVTDGSLLAGVFMRG